MATNADLFKDYLKKENFYTDNWKTDDGNEVFQLRQKLENGPDGRLLIVLDKENNIVSIYALDYVTLSNPSRKDYMYRLLNELNMKYTYNKFTLSEDNNIIVSCFIPFDNNFKPEIVMQNVYGAYKAMQNEYPGLMKVMWS